MATFKICVFKHQKRTDGKYPVSIRVYWKRQYSYIKSEYYVTDKQINKKSFELKDTFILNDLNARILRYENLKVQQLGQNIELYSAKELAKFFETESKPGTDDSINFIAFARKHCEKLKKEKRESTAATMIRSVNALQDYINGSDKLPITQLTAKFLKGFETFLQNPREIIRLNQFGRPVTIKSKGLGQVSISDYMTDIRTIFNAALDEYNDPDTGLVKIQHYPFRKYKIEQPPKSKNRTLTVEQIQSIRDLKEPQIMLPRAILSRDVFMLSFYLGGCNLKDIYDAEHSQVKDGRFSYERSKTKRRRKDNAFISIEIQPEALPYFEKYKDPEGLRIFNFYSKYSNSHIFSSNVNKGLKKIAELCGIDEPLSTYYARHSLATIARNKCDISKDDINLLLNHVDQDMLTTDIYIEKDWTMVDNAIRKVLDLILNIDDLL